jgi:hypothetical protein
MGFETWSVTFMEEYRLKVHDKRELRRTVECKRGK